MNRAEIERVISEAVGPLVPVASLAALADRVPELLFLLDPQRGAWIAELERRAEIVAAARSRQAEEAQVALAVRERRRRALTFVRSR